MAENDANLLTDEMVRDAPTKKKPYTIRDGRGLFVLVHQNGSRYFQLRATVHGKRKLMQIGVYPTISIAEARVLAAQRLEEALNEGANQSGALDLSAAFKEDAPSSRTQDRVEAVEADDESLADRSVIESKTIEIKDIHLAKEAEIVPQSMIESEQSAVGDFAEETLLKRVPKVDLAYSDLVYVTKNPNKTFVDKLKERTQFDARVAEFKKKAVSLYRISRAWIYTQAILMGLKLRALRARVREYDTAQLKDHLRLGQVKSDLKRISSLVLTKVNQLMRSALVAVSHLYALAKAQFKHLWASCRLRFKGALKQNKPTEIALKGGATLTSTQSLPMSETKPNIEAEKIYTILPKPLTLNHIIRENLSSLIAREQQVMRQDGVRAYGLFAESKGNYLIYTIKTILLMIMTWKG